PREPDRGPDMAKQIFPSLRPCTSPERRSGISRAVDLMPTLHRLCPSCRQVRITVGKRCTACERLHEARRGSPAARGLDATYRRNRAAVLASSDVCHLCGLGGADTADHLV